MEDKSENKGLKSEVLKATDGYREGAIAGALVGLIIAAYLKKNIMIGVVIGMVGGGYIGWSARNSGEETTEFKKQ